MVIVVVVVVVVVLVLVLVLALVLVLVLVLVLLLVAIAVCCSSPLHERRFHARGALVLVLVLALVLVAICSHSRLLSAAHAQISRSGFTSFVHRCGGLGTFMLSRVPIVLVIITWISIAQAIAVV